MTRVAMITGGQQGIGFGIAQALAGAGFTTVLAAQLDETDPAVQQALQQLGSDARYFRHDLADITAIPRLLDRVERECGAITTLISNAGVPAKIRGDMLDITPENFDFANDINLRGGFFLAQQIARRMLAADDEAYRSIIFVTSVSAEMVSVERAEYCISKAAAAMMAQLFAVRLAPAGIGVFEIRPGIIHTAMTDAVQDKYTARIEGGLVPAARWGMPQDIALAVLPLVQGQMAFANGAVIPVDGGLSIQRL